MKFQVGDLVYPTERASEQEDGLVIIVDICKDRISVRNLSGGHRYVIGINDWLIYFGQATKLEKVIYNINEEEV